MKYGNDGGTGRAVSTLAALANNHRLRVYRLLVEAGPQGLNAGTIASRLGLQPSSLTFHLQHLQRAGLVTQIRQSRERIYAADFPVMGWLVDYLTENCCTSSRECRAPRSRERRGKAQRVA